MRQPEAVGARLVEPATARMSQRDVMRNLIRCFNDDHDKVAAASAAAERRREVSRSCDDLSPVPPRRRALAYREGVSEHDVMGAG